MATLIVSNTGVNRKVANGKHWSELEEMLVKSMVHTFCRNSERTFRTNEQLFCVKPASDFLALGLDDLSIWEQTWNTDKVLSISYWPFKSDF